MTATPTSTTGRRDRIAVQALVEEQTVLGRDHVRLTLVDHVDGTPRYRWEALSGRLYTLGLDESQLRFLALVLSIAGIGHTPLAAVEDLDERRLKIVLRAIVELAGNDRVAVRPRQQVPPAPREFRERAGPDRIGSAN